MINASGRYSIHVVGLRWKTGMVKVDASTTGFTSEPDGVVMGHLPCNVATTEVALKGLEGLWLYFCGGRP